MDTKRVIGRSRWVFIFGLLSFFATKTLYADQGGATAVSWKLLIFGLLGGLAFFLYGIEKMSVGMQKTAGNKMRAVLAAITKTASLLLGSGRGLPC